MSGAETTFIIADSPRSAEQAAPFVDGDAIIHVGPGAASPVLAGSVSRVVVSGPFADDRWAAEAFAAAEAALTPGGRMLLVLPDHGADVRPEQDLRVLDLPGSVHERWRVVGMSMEHRAVAAILVPTADDDGAEQSALDLRVLQIAAFVCRNPDLIDDCCIPSVRAAVILRERHFDPNAEAEIAGLRRELDRYGNSLLGRTIREYRAVIGRLRGADK